MGVLSVPAAMVKEVVTETQGHWNCLVVQTVRQTGCLNIVFKTACLIWSLP